MFFSGDWKLPTDKEIGSAICKTRDGKLVPGQFSSGSMNHVDVDLTCPANTVLNGVFHTHPMGLAQPSKQDYSQARKFGIKKLCITATHPDKKNETRCFKVR